MLNYIIQSIIPLTILLIILIGIKNHPEAIGTLSF